MLFDYLPKAFCVVHGKMVNVIGDNRYHLVSERAFALCEGPLITCPPTWTDEDDWASLFSMDPDTEELEQEELPIF